MMSQCQSLQYALGICAICFLLNGISAAEGIVREQYATASKAAIEPEGKKSFYFELKSPLQITVSFSLSVSIKTGHVNYDAIDCM